MARPKITIEDWNQATDEWAIPVGRFLLAFSGCEHWTHLILRTFGDAQDYDEVAERKLSDRVRECQRLLADMPLSAPTRRQVNACFGTLMRLQGPRNLLAHNPPMAWVEKNQNGDLRVSNVLLNVVKPDERVTLEQLKRYQVEAFELDLALMELVTAIDQDLAKGGQEPGAGPPP